MRSPVFSLTTGTIYTSLETARWDTSEPVRKFQPRIQICLLEECSALYRCVFLSVPEIWNVSWVPLQPRSTMLLRDTSLEGVRHCVYL